MDALTAVLQKLVGLHRQLLEVVRAEREALVQADRKGIEDAFLAKEGLCQEIQRCESDRVTAVGALALRFNRPASELSLREIIKELEPTEAQKAEQLRSLFNALTVLVDRVRVQNASNGDLLARSIEHVKNMKDNILGAREPENQTYTARGQKSTGTQQARFLSQEA